jgi:hydrogenase maturation protein HypF
MENYETLEFFEETLESLKAVYRVNPAAIAHDLHPRYFSTRWALEQSGVEKHGIQHHYAHVGSVMAEAGLREEVIGVALDGSGYGGDGTVWGGEFLVARRNGFERRAHFRAVPMPGGEAAARNPWQMALSYLADLHGEAVMEVAESSGITERVGRTAVENVLKIRKNSSLSPLTSGAGRLFESVSSLLGIRDVNTFEGEAAMALEAEAAGGEEGVYPYDIQGSDPVEISFSGAVAAVLKDAASDVSRGRAAARFHNTVADAVIEMVRRLHRETGIADVALTGGVFQNRYLLARVIPGLSALGLRPHTNARVPANDAGISLGQAFLLRSRL